VKQIPQGQIGHVALLFIARLRLRCSPRPPDASHAIPPRVRRHWSFSVCSDLIFARWVSGLGFVAQPSNPTVLWWTAANPACRLRSLAGTLHRLLSTTLSCFCHHAAHTWPCWPPVPSSWAYLSLHSSKARNAFLPIFLPLMQNSQFFFPWCKTPPRNMNWVLSSPLFVMYESCLQMQACASQIYKEHNNTLRLRHRQAR
jgi:hypothetical protein